MLTRLSRQSRLAVDYSIARLQRAEAGRVEQAALCVAHLVELLEDEPVHAGGRASTGEGRRHFRLPESACAREQPFFHPRR
jgi:hypothetical protein